MTAVVALLGCAFAAGLVALTRALAPSLSSWSTKGRRSGTGIVMTPVRIAGPIVGAILLSIATGIIAFGLAAGIAGFIAPMFFGDNRSARNVARLEGLALWLEAMRDSVSGGTGLNEAIQMTAAHAPAAIVSELRRLAADLAAGKDPEIALRTFADAMDDELADVCVAGLIQAMQPRHGTGVASMLSEVATAAREEIAMRQRVAISERKSRNELKGVIAISALVAFLMPVVGRKWMKPYHTLEGAIAIVFIFGIYLVAIALFARIARPVKAPRLFTPIEDQRSAA